MYAKKSRTLLPLLAKKRKTVAEKFLRDALCAKVRSFLENIALRQI